MLILDNRKTWPRHIVEQLNAKSVKSLLKNHNSMDWPTRILDDFDLQSIFVDVQEYAESEGIAVYHCTKQLPDKPFKKNGLRILDFEMHHKEFLEYVRCHKLADKGLFDRMDKALLDWRNNPSGRREKQLWFCFTRYLILDLGTECFFKYYGGEAVYMPFIYEPKMKDVARLLEQMGEPVIVEARVHVQSINNLGEYALGRTLVSYFAKSINPNFSIEDREGYVTRDITPDDIIEVYPHKKFVESLEQETE